MLNDGQLIWSQSINWDDVDIRRVLLMISICIRTCTHSNLNATRMCMLKFNCKTRRCCNFILYIINLEGSFFHMWSIKLWSAVKCMDQPNLKEERKPESLGQHIFVQRHLALQIIEPHELSFVLPPPAVGPKTVGQLSVMTSNCTYTHYYLEDKNSAC